MWMLGTEPGSSAKQPVLLIFEPFPVLSMGEQDSHLFVGRAILKERGTHVCFLTYPSTAPDTASVAHVLRIGTVEHILTW